MSESNIEQGILKEVPYVILVRVENGEVVEIMTVGTISIEQCEGREPAAMTLMNPKITKTHKKHFMFEDMLPLVDMRDLMKEEDSVNQRAKESQSLRKTLKIL